jgi:hypothetical protein
MRGIKINLSRSGPSVSFGDRGFHYTLGTKGKRITVGLPGSGLSWTEYEPYAKDNGQTQQNQQTTGGSSRSRVVIWVCLLIVAAVILAFIH